MIINISKINLSGCSGGGGGDSKVISTKNFEVTANGTTNIVMDQGVDGISAGTITTNVQPTLTAATFDQNGTYTPGSGVDGFNSVTVNVDGAVNRLNKFLKDQVTALTQSDFDGVRSVPAYAFYQKTNLKSVDLTPSVESLGSNSFQNAGIVSIDVSNVKVMGDSVFSNCSSLTGITGFDKYTHDATNSLFRDCYNLTGDLTTGMHGYQYASSVFTNCSNLTSITFLSNMTEVGGSSVYANWFAGCSKIEYLDFTHNYTIPNLRVANPFTAFTQNYEIKVPQILYDEWTAATNWNGSNVVGHIVAYPNAYDVTSIKYTTNDGNDITPYTQYTSTTWDAKYVGSEFDASTGGTVSFYGPSIYIPERAYSGKTTLESVEIPETVKVLHNYTFSNCTSLVSVKLPNSLEIIDGEVFANCTSLTGITIPDAVTQQRIYGNAFTGCTGLTEVVLGEGITELKATYNGPHNLMRVSPSLTAATFGSQLTAIYQPAPFNSGASVSNITFKSTTPPEWDSSLFTGVAAAGTLHVPAEAVSTYTSWIATKPISGWTVTAIS